MFLAFVQPSEGKFSIAFLRNGTWQKGEGEMQNKCSFWRYKPFLAIGSAK
jgi:hypothetical protein